MLAPGLEMAAQVLDITDRYKPDFAIAHLFGRSPSVSIKELKAKGYPLDFTLGGMVPSIQLSPATSVAAGCRCGQ